MYNDSLSGPVAHSVGQSLTQWASRSLSGPVAHSVKTCPLWISISSDSACKLSAKFLIYYYFIISVMIAQRDRSLSVLPVARVQFLATAEYFKGFFPGWSHSANPSWDSVAENGLKSPLKKSFSAYISSELMLIGCKVCSAVHAWARIVYPVVRYWSYRFTIVSMSFSHTFPSTYCSTTRDSGMAQKWKILISSHAERPLWEWAPHITPCSYCSSKPQA